MAKRSRRARRQQSEKGRRVGPTAVQPAPVEKVPADTAAPRVAVETTLPTKRRTLDFVKEYAYVYKELRNVLIIAILMFVVLVGLSFLI